MKVWGVNEVQLQDIATELSVSLYGMRKDGRALRFQLKPAGETRNGNHIYQRTSASGWSPERRVHAVCWHGHRDFMREVFKLNADARIKTGWADYKGQADFLEKFPETGHRNVGSIMYPVMASQVCKCAKGDWLVDLSIYPDWSEYRMKQDTLKSCPHVIFHPEHYRPDGSCKCNDPTEQERMIKEWGYSREDFAA